MAYDIFHNYGFDKVTKKSLTEAVDHDAYASADRVMDAHWHEVQRQYLEGDKSPAGILTSLGYIESPVDEHKYEKEAGEFTLVFDFTDYDWDDGPIVYYVLDASGRIPSGYCQTKAELKEPEDWTNEGCEGESGCKEEDNDFLNKSFKRNYGIDDNVDDDSYNAREGILTEAYNNLPSWFTDFLDNSSDGKSVKKILSNRGIDLANATYIKGVFPRSNRDPVLKDESRLTIFRLNDGRSDEKIYIVGVNNPWLHLPGSWDSKYANELPMKTILSMATEYGYIDTNDSRNSNKDKRAERAALRRIDVAGPQRGVGQHPVERKIYATDEYGRKDWNNVIGTEIEWVMTKGQDKSGYPLDPEKYVKMLDKVGLDTYAARLESYYKKIESVRTRLIALFDKFDANDSDKYRTYGSFSRNVHEDIAEAMNSWSRAIKSYQTLKNEVAEIVARHGESPSERTDERIQHAFAWEGKSFRDYLKDAVDLISKIEKTERLPDRD